jgi:hypothetical protein
LSGELKEAAGGLAVFGLVCLAAGLVFPPAAVVGAVALELSEAALVVGVAVDVAVAIDHPTQDNWVTVGGDALAIATGYAVGKVIIGPALGAVARKLAQREALAAEAAAAKAEADKLAAEQAAAAKAAADKLAVEQAAAKAAADKLAAEKTAIRTAQLAAARQAADEVAAVGAKSRLATEEEAAAIYKLREDLRAENAAISEGANVATAKGTIDGQQIDLKANSSKTTGKGTVPHKLPAKQQLKTQPNLKDLEKNARPDTFRAYDSEAKILEKVLDDTTPTSTGEITITSLNDFCNSCENAIGVQMSKLRPGIKINKVYVQPYKNK